MNILIACEYSGRVREAFRAAGHYAVSCDLLPTEQEGEHFQCDVREVLDYGWDMMIAHPPCTYLSYAGNRWLKQEGRHEKMLDALRFFNLLLDAPITRIAVENPRGWTWKYVRKPDQVVHPYHFGEPFTKATCFWLKGLPLLRPTDVCDEYFVNWTKYKGSHNGHARSKTWIGMALAMASQWNF
jgi:site-specific DNA-cytosine methylase